MSKLLYIILVVFTLSINLYSQNSNKGVASNKPPEELTKICDDFFNLLIHEDFTKAFKTFLKNSPFANKDEQVEKLITEFQRANKTYGSIKGYEIAHADIVTSSFLKLNYLAYHIDVPMRWVFTFYKSPSKGWMLINIKFDDLTEKLFIDHSADSYSE